MKQNQSWESVVLASNDVFIADQGSVAGPFFTPNLVFWSVLFLVIIVSILARRKGVSLRRLDFILFLVYGLLGLFLLLLWLATDHAAASWNLNILLAWPTHLVVSFFLLTKDRRRWVNWYLLITVVLGLLLVISWSLIPQSLNNALIPITLLIAARSGFAIFD